MAELIWSDHALAELESIFDYSSRLSFVRSVHHSEYLQSLRDIADVSRIRTASAGIPKPASQRNADG